MRLSGYQERDEEKRQKFKLEISKTKPEDRVYIDESGVGNYLKSKFIPIALESDRFILSF
jgi:hypothetical protein